MKRLSTFIFILTILYASTSYAQLTPDWSTYIVLEGPGGLNDSVKIGFSTAASEYYDPGYDVIDTSALDPYLDIRIFNPNVVFNEDECYNMNTSYSSYPQYSINEDTIKLVFDIVLLIENYIDYNIKLNLSDYIDFRYQNSEGWGIANIKCDALNTYIGGIDGTEFNVGVWDENFGVERPEVRFSVSSTDITPFFPFPQCPSPSKGVRITLNILNSLFTNIEDESASHNSQAVVQGSRIDLGTNYSTVKLYAIDGKKLSSFYSVRYLETQDIYPGIYLFVLNDTRRVKIIIQ